MFGWQVSTTADNIKVKVHNVAYEIRKLNIENTEKKTAWKSSVEAIIRGECEILQQFLDLITFSKKHKLFEHTSTYFLNKTRNDSDEDNVLIQSICVMIWDAVFIKAI